MSYVTVPLSYIVQLIQGTQVPIRKSIPICPEKTQDGKCMDCGMIDCDCHASECECDDCEESKLLEIEQEIEKETDTKLKLEFDMINTCTVCGEQTHKTKECFKYKVTLCMYSDKCTRKHCTFAHEEKELRKPQELYCSQTIKCDGYDKEIGCLGIEIGCGGCHKFELCKKVYCKWCLTSDHWTGTTDKCFPYCKYCKKEGHDFATCPKKHCKTCGDKGHWFQQCDNQYVIHQ